MPEDRSPGRFRRGVSSGPVVIAVTMLTMIGAGLVFTPLGGWVAGLTEDGSGPAGAVDATPQTALVTIVDLTEKSEVEATVVATETMAVTSHLQGTFTMVSTVGQHLAPGDVIFAIDENPVVYLPGSVPAWRTMTVDSVGPDVEQLEQALVNLGYDTAGELSVDDTFTSYTATLVSDWQEDLGVEPTGTVDHGTVVFAPPAVDGRAIVTTMEASVGDQASASVASVAELSDGRRHVEIVVDHNDRPTLGEGKTVDVRFPDRSTRTATVYNLQDLGQGQWLINASLDAPDPDLSASLTDLPVNVSWSTTVSENALTVPAPALVRHDHGSYMVSVVDENGSTRVVDVVPVAAADRVVEVAGDLREGDLVVVP